MCGIFGIVDSANNVIIKDLKAFGLCMQNKEE